MIDEADLAEAFFVRLEGASMLVDYPGTRHDLENAWDAVRDAGLVPVDTPLYGIPRTLKRLEQRTGWKDFFPTLLPLARDYVVAHAQDMADVAAWDEFRNDEFVKLVRALDRATMRDGTIALQLKEAEEKAEELLKEMALVREIEKAFNIEAPPRKTTFKPGGLIKKCEKRYPLAAVIAKHSYVHHFGPSEREVVAQYINSIK